MDKKPSQINIISTINIVLAAISLLADIIALAQVAFQIIAKNESANIALQLVAIVLVFLLGYGLGTLGLRGLKRTSTDKVLQIYVWGYLILACLSYLGVVISFRHPYSLSSYIAYFVIIALQLGAFATLRSACQKKPTTSHAVALMTVSVMHALIFLYQFIFGSIPKLIFVMGEWFFWLAWTLYATLMVRDALAGKGRQSQLRED